MTFAACRPSLLVVLGLLGCLPPLPPVDTGSSGDTDGEPDSDADTDSDSDSDTDADSDSDTDADTDADSDADTEPDPDADGDGYPASTDCDDADPAVNPGMDERCGTGKDDDCSGTTNDADALGCTEFRQDADGDGYGSAISACLCRAEGAFDASNQDDCDDSDAAVNPSEAEVCNDHLDNDCDGAADPSCGMSSASVTAADITLTESLVASANFSFGLTAGGDVNGDGFEDIVVGAPYSTTGTAFVKYGPITGRSLDLASGDVILTGEPSMSHASLSLGMGDLDADGIDYLVVGAPGSGSSPSVCIEAGGSLRTSTLSTARTTIVGTNSFGNALTIGDVTGDGAADLVIGNMNNQRAYVFPSPVAVGELDTTDAVATMVTTDFGRNIGASVALGDVDGDGIDDLVTGDYLGAEVYQGGSIHGTLSEADAALFSASSGHETGYSVCVGDVNGDGFADFGVGAPYEGSDNQGRVYLVSGAASLSSRSLSSSTASIEGSSSQAMLGLSVSCSGDFDGDGFADLVIGEPYRSSNTGTAYVFAGPVSGSTTPTSADFTLSGSTSSGQAGYSLATMDVNADGYDDLLVGAPFASSYYGAVYGFYGGGL